MDAQINIARLNTSVIPSTLANPMWALYVPTHVQLAWGCHRIEAIVAELTLFSSDY